jgi:hypothetical protein
LPLPFPPDLTPPPRAQVNVVEFANANAALAGLGGVGAPPAE